MQRTWCLTVTKEICAQRFGCIFKHTHTHKTAHMCAVLTQREHTRRVHITHTVGKEWAVDVAAAAAAAALPLAATTTGD